MHAAHPKEFFPHDAHRARAATAGIVLFVLTTLVASVARGQIPLIDTVSPNLGAVGYIVIVSGTNFSAAAGGNIVFFGATRAEIISAAPGSLSVKVPRGATLAPVTVTVAGRTAWASRPFTPTFPGVGNLTSNSFSPMVEFATAALPRYFAAGDLDGDGKADVVVGHENSSFVSIYRNTSSTGSITTNSFAARVDLPAGGSPMKVALGDLDGDGRLDLVAANSGSSSISIFRNVSTAGLITAGSFAAAIELPTLNYPFGAAIRDLNGDGRADLVVINGQGSSVSLFENLGGAGLNTNTFAPRVDIRADQNPWSLAVGDLDGDGQPDLAVGTVGVGGDEVSIYRNLGLPGALTTNSFAANQDFPTGVAPSDIALCDLDGDGKLDLAVADENSAAISLLRNTSISGVIDTGSFAAKVDFAVASAPVGVAIGDLDGDARPDLAVSDTGGAAGTSVSVFRNLSSVPGIAANSLAARVDFLVGTSPAGIAVVDLDGDGQPEIIMANSRSPSLGVLRNVAPRIPPLFLASQGSGTVTAPPASSHYQFGQMVTLTATPRNTNWTRFLRWSDGNTNNPRPITIGLSNNFAAIFTNTVPLEELAFKVWELDLGGAEDDELHTALPTPDGGWLLAGDSYSPAGGLKTAPNRGNSARDWWVVKLRANRAIEWQETYGGDGDEFLKVAVATEDGGFLLGGHSTSGISGNKTTAGFGGEDIWLVKINGAGAIEWQQAYGGGSHDNVSAIQPTEDGGYLLAGGSNTSSTLGNKETPGVGAYDVYLIKVSHHGAIEWQRIYGGGDHDFAGYLVPSPYGGFLTGGSRTRTNPFNYDYWPIRINTLGEMQWGTPYGSSVAELGAAALATIDGFLLGGYSESGGGDRDRQTPGFGKADFWLVKLNLDGGMTWEQVFGGSEVDVMTAMVPTSGGGSWLAGYSDSPASGSPVNGNKQAANFGLHDWWLVQVDAQGAYLREYAWGGSGNDYPYFLQPTTGGLLIGGASSSGISGNKTTSGHGGTDYWLLNLATREAPVGTPAVLVNGLYSPADTHAVTNATFALVEMQSTFPGGHVFYTQNGSAPSSNSAAYTVPVAFASDATLRVIAYNSNYTASAEASPVSLMVKPITFSVANAGSGSVTISPQTNQYFIGQALSLTATPRNTNWTRFLRWSDGDTNNPRATILGASNVFTAIFTNFVPLEELAFKQWDASFGGPDDEVAQSIRQTGDGGFLVAGTSYSGISGNKTSANNGNEDWWVIKLGADGRKLWDKSYGGSGRDSVYGNTIVLTDDGGCILGGSFNTRDCWLMRLDANGNVLWENRFAGGSIQGIELTADGGLLAAASSETGTAAGKTSPYYGSADIWVLRFDAGGNEVWENSFGGSGTDVPFSVARCADGGFLIGGYSDSPVSGNKTNSGYGGEDFWVVKMDGQGNKLWDRCYGGTLADRLASLAPAGDGGYLLGGTSRSGVSGMKTTANYGLFDDFWVIRIDDTGNPTRQNSFGGDNQDLLFHVAPRGDGTFLFGGGSISGVGGTKTSPNFGDYRGGNNYDYWVAQMDSAGNQRWDRSFGGTLQDYLFSATATTDNGYALAGVSWSDISGNKSSPLFGIGDFWVLKLATREAPVGTPAILVNGFYSPTNSHTITNSTAALVELQTSFPGGRLFYTQTGSAPSSNSIPYAGPITFLSDATLRVVAYNSNFTASIEADPVSLSVRPITFLVANTGSGGVTVSPRTSQYFLGQSLTLTATPRNTNWTRFLRWSDGDTNATRNITVGPSNVFTAVFTNITPLEELAFPLWQRVFGGTDVDRLQTMLRTPDGGFLLGGSSYSGTNGNRTSPSFSPGVADYWIVKIDDDGNKQWDRAYGGSALDTLYAMSLTADGGYILAGESESGANGNKTDARYGIADMWVVKIDANGNKQWDRTYGGNTGVSGAYAVHQTFDGGYIIGGYSTAQSNVVSASGNKTAPGHGAHDIWIIKTDGAGNIEWDRGFGSDSMDGFGAVHQTADGGYFVGGTARVNASSGRFWGIKLDAAGSRQWDTTFIGANPGSTIDFVNSANQLADGGYFLGGAGQSQAGGDKSGTNFGSYDFWLLRLDSGGRKAWDRTFGGAGDDQLTAAEPLRDGGFILGGFTGSGASGNKLTPGFGGNDFWAVRLDAQGERRWELTLGGGEQDEMKTVLALGDDGYLFGGLSSSTNSGNKSAPNFGTQDYWIVRAAAREAPVGTPVVLVNGQYSPSNRFDIPATNAISVTLETSFASAELYYTTDGGDPAFAVPYTGPITGIVVSSTVRAFAFDLDTGNYQEADPVQINLPLVFSLTASTPGGGSVSLDIPGGAYVSNTLVTLTAVASNGWTFLRWTGDAGGTATNLPVVMNRARNVQAIFGTPLLNTNVPVTFGATLREPEQALYEFGQIVRLTAVPTNPATPAKYFTQWGQAATGIYTNPLLWAVTSPTQTVRATYGTLPAGTFALNTLINGNGVVARNPQQSNYTSGASVTLTAAPAPGNVFAGWSGDAVSPLNPLTVVMNTNKALTAAFIPNDNLTVTTLFDSGPGSLRQAIADVAAGGRIQFAVTGVIALAGNELPIDKPMSLLGPGASRLAINGSGASRVLNVSASGVVVAGLTLTNGFFHCDAGGGIYNSGGLTLSNCSVAGCYATLGAGIMNAGQLSVFGCSIFANVTCNGGGFFAGGGIHNFGLLAVENATLSGNHADNGGGAIFNLSNAVAVLHNTTIAGNSSGFGGGIHSDPSGTLTLVNSIVAANAAGVGPDIYGPVNSGDFNLIQSSSGAVIGGVTARNLIGVNPLLGPLSDNGGPTPTHALLPGSPAIDAGSSGGVSLDQRGVGRPFDFPGLLNANDGSDIGAFELDQEFNAPPIVNITSPEDGAVIPFAGVLLLQAGASDADGAVARVEFYSGAALIGAATNPPFTFNWTNAVPASYSLTAVAVDLLGARGTSPPVNIIIQTSIPQVALTLPTNGTAVTTPGAFQLATIVSDADNSVARVEFFAGANLIGSATTPPYQFTWTNVPPGNYTLVARAVDAFGPTADSAPVSVTVLPEGHTGQGFHFSAVQYQTNESAGFAIVTVEREPGGPEVVNYRTENGTASTARPDYLFVAGALTFSNGAPMELKVPLVDNCVIEGGRAFQMQLLDQTSGLPFSTATITITDNDTVNSPCVSYRTPDAAMAQSSLRITLVPPTNTGWRFAWEHTWRASGAVVPGLAAGLYPVVYKPVQGYDGPSDPGEVSVSVPANTNVALTARYFETGVPQTGRLTVVIEPPSIADAASWSLAGEPGQFASGYSTNLPLGDYVVVPGSVNGWNLPSPTSVAVSPTEQRIVTLRYEIAETWSGGGSPATPEDVGNGAYQEIINALPGLPYGWNGQIVSDLGRGSGVVVRDRVVLTAAHVVWDENRGEPAGNLRWFFQRHTGEFEPIPLTPRGVLLLTNFLFARSNYLASGGTNGIATPESRRHDVAVLYFDRPAGRAGFNGYLVSSKAANTWLLGSFNKMLVGYPTEGPGVVPGKIHATPQPAVRAFTASSDGVYQTADIRGFAGNSGGPLYVQPIGGVYYPAGVFLGSSASFSYVRGIDEEAARLINLAAALAVSEESTNQLDPSFLRFDLRPTTGGGLFRKLFVNLEPAVATNSGARWNLVEMPAGLIRLTNQLSSVQESRLLQGTNYLLTFNPAIRHLTPLPYSLIITGAYDLVITATYHVPRLQLSTQGVDLIAPTGRVYDIQHSVNLITWSTWSSVTPTSTTINVVPATNFHRPQPAQEFYRVRAPQ